MYIPLAETANIVQCHVFAASCVTRSSLILSSCRQVSVAPRSNEGLIHGCARCCCGARVLSTTGTSACLCPINRCRTNNSAQLSSGDCPSASFKFLTAQRWVKAAKPGWNIGNTLDPLPDEGSWNNPRLQASTLDYVKAAGFKSVRLPGMGSDSPVSKVPFSLPATNL